MASRTWTSGTLLPRLLLVWFLRVGLLGLLNPRIPARSSAESRLVLAIAVLLPILLLDLHRILQRRLIRSGEQSAAIRVRIVNKLPLVVVVFLVELTN